LAESAAARKSSQGRARKPVTKPAKGLRAFLYDADARDEEVALRDHLARDLRKDQLLWVDVDLSSKAALEQLTTLVELGDDEFSDEARLPMRERGDYFSFTVPTLISPDDDAEFTSLTCSSRCAGWSRRTAARSPSWTRSTSTSAPTAPSGT
jgi:hypothetical protein